MTEKTRTEDEAFGQAADRSCGLRLDKWLWQARFFKTRTLAAAAVGKGKTRVNRMLVTKPHYKVRPGDVLTFAQGRDIRVIRVVALGERRGPAPEARTLYEDIGEPSIEKPASADRPHMSAGTQPRTEAWGGKGGIDPRRARRQAIDAKMNGR
ncbi:MAG: RNA-binding S4 domain-containing protein [Geminicoccaceae bacterium]